MVTIIPDTIQNTRRDGKSLMGVNHKVVYRNEEGAHSGKMKLMEKKKRQKDVVLR